MSQRIEKEQEKKNRFRIPSLTTKCYIYKTSEEMNKCFVVEMRTWKIGLQNFLYSRKMPRFEDSECDIGSRHYELSK